MGLDASIDQILGVLAPLFAGVLIATFGLTVTLGVFISLFWVSLLFSIFIYRKFSACGL